VNPSQSSTGLVEELAVDIDKLIDTYVLKARIFPGLIVALPIVADALYFAPALGNWSLFGTTSLCCIALLYGLGHVVRALGGSIEATLWCRWDGPPSTRYMRHRDRTFGPSLKAPLHKAVAEQFGIRLFNEAEELANRVGADKEISDAFVRVRQYLRQHDPDGLWSKHNVEYGFSRNLLACRTLWLVIALCAIGVAVILAAKTGSGVLNPAFVIGAISLICSVYVGWFLLPSATKKIGERYAESAWMAFLHVAENSSAHVV
jgi:hypothetical protein